MESEEKGKRKHVVAIGGGTGTFVVLSGLKRLPGIRAIQMKRPDAKDFHRETPDLPAIGSFDEVDWVL